MPKTDPYQQQNEITRRVIETIKNKEISFANAMNLIDDTRNKVVTIQKQNNFLELDTNTMLNLQLLRNFERELEIKRDYPEVPLDKFLSNNCIGLRRVTQKKAKKQVNK